MKVTVVGGGLVGSLAACLMGQRGHEVELFEFRPDPKSPEGKLIRGRSINLALSNRGRAALAKAGLEEKVLSKAIPMKGRMLHSQDGSTKKVLYDPVSNQCIYSVSRRFLNELLLEEAGDLPNVQIKFKCKLSSADLESGETNFLEKFNGESQVSSKADLVIGADGAHSTLRQSFLKRPLTNFSQKYIEHGYIELYMPPTSDNKYALEKGFLHIWPRDRFMLIALPNLDGSFTVTLFMPFEIFHTLKTADSVLSFFEAQFPDAVPLIGKESLCQDVLTTKPSPLVSISCFPLNAGKSVLVGDAAHAMVPFYGQGMNAGFEDISILDEIMENASSSEVEDRLEKFSTKRSRDAQAICELAMYNYTEMRHLVNQKSFYVRRTLDLFLYRLMGSRWTPLYTSVTFSNIPYAECINNKRWQDEVVEKAAVYSTWGLIGMSTLALVGYTQRGLNLLKLVENIKTHV